MARSIERRLQVLSSRSTLDARPAGPGRAQAFLIDFRGKSRGTTVTAQSRRWANTHRDLAPVSITRVVLAGAEQPVNAGQAVSGAGHVRSAPGTWKLP